MGVSDEEVFKDMDYDDLKMLTVNIPTLARLRKYYRTLQEQHDDDDDGIPSKRSKMESTPHAKSKLFDSSMSLTHKVRVSALCPRYRPLPTVWRQKNCLLLRWFHKFMWLSGQCFEPVSSQQAFWKRSMGFVVLGL